MSRKRKNEPTVEFSDEVDGDVDDEDEDEDEGGLPIWEAKDIWLSNGMDEDYTFGYSEDELRREAGLD